MRNGIRLTVGIKAGKHPRRYPLGKVSILFGPCFGITDTLRQKASGGHSVDCRI
jgi:hypothetical protein